MVFVFSSISKLTFSFLNLRKGSKNRHQFEYPLSQLLFPQALLRKSFLPHRECSMTRLHQEPWDSRGSFAMILWGFGPEEESRNFKSFDILCIILFPFNCKFKKNCSEEIFRHQMQHEDLMQDFKRITILSPIPEMSSWYLRSTSLGGENLKVAQHFHVPGIWDLEWDPISSQHCKTVPLNFLRAFGYFKSFWMTSYSTD